MQVKITKVRQQVFKLWGYICYIHCQGQEWTKVNTEQSLLDSHIDFHCVLQVSYAHFICLLKIQWRWAGITDTHTYTCTYTHTGQLWLQSMGFNGLFIISLTWSADRNPMAACAQAHFPFTPDKTMKCRLTLGLNKFSPWCHPPRSALCLPPCCNSVVSFIVLLRLNCVRGEGRRVGNKSVKLLRGHLSEDEAGRGLMRQRDENHAGGLTRIKIFSQVLNCWLRSH